MRSASRAYWIHTITPLHVGTGRGIGFIDLPIMREKTTNWPIIPGSTVKGVWRSRSVQVLDQALVEAAFGKGSEAGEDHAGSLAITDARIVLLPVRSLFGTFAYVTSPTVLTRLKRDMEAIGVGALPEVPSCSEFEKIAVTSRSVLGEQEKVYLEDLDFVHARGERERIQSSVDRWARFLSDVLYGYSEDEAMKESMRSRFAVVSDPAFDYFCEQGTEVNARIRIDDSTKTVKGGQLWYEEYLPAETVLVGIVVCDRVYGTSSLDTEKLLDSVCGDGFVCQMGGKSTTGKGITRIVFSRGA